MKTFTSGILPVKVKVARIVGNWVESMLNTGPGWISKEKRFFTPSGFCWRISAKHLIGIIVSICKSRLLSCKEERNVLYQTKLMCWVITYIYMYCIFSLKQIRWSRHCFISSSMCLPLFYSKCKTFNRISTSSWYSVILHIIIKKTLEVDCCFYCFCYVLNYFIIIFLQIW